MRVLLVLLVVLVVVGGALSQEHNIPTLDLNDWYFGNDEQKQTFASAWNDAFHVYGFCVLKNHKVVAMSPFFEEVKEFFSLPIEEKMKYQSKGDIYGPGFHAFGSERQRDDDGKKKPDLNENFQFYASQEDYYTVVPPREEAPTELFDKVVAYYQESLALLTTILEISDMALSLPKGTFSDLYFKEGYLRSIRLANYFEIKDEELLKTTRIGSHTDYTGFTLLKTDEVPGLEVAVGESHYDVKDLKVDFDEWVPAPIVPDSIIINAGDMIRYFTNGHWKSAYHRVVATKPQRFSVVLFTGPGLQSQTDTRIESCKICKNEVKRFGDIKMSMEDYLVWRTNFATLDQSTKEEL